MQKIFYLLYEWFMAKPLPHRYLIQIKDASGSGLFSASAHWRDKEKRIAFAQIMRLPELPEVSFHSEPAFEPRAGEGKADGRAGRPIRRCKHPCEPPRRLAASRTTPTRPPAPVDRPRRQ